MSFRCRLTRKECQDPRGAARRTNRNRRRSTFTCLAIWAALSSAWSFSQAKPTSQPTPPPKAVSSGSTTKTLTDAQMSQMSSDELANYVFQQHGCKNCHTLGKAGKLGLTDQGMEVGKNYEGCVSLLTSMNLIAQLKDAERTSAQKKMAARFQEFGCTTCHQIVAPGKMGLTSSGVKLKSMHMACTDVEKLMSQQR
jgi:cytochrome c551/c552